MFIKILAFLLLTVTLAIAVMKTPELHNLYLRHKVGTKVYIIKGIVEGGGGTGFAVKGASGISYIITNSHVCTYAESVSEVKGTVLVATAEKNMRRRIIENSDFTDLCLIEGLPGVEGLSLGATPIIGSTMTLIGHPLLLPLTVSIGEITAKHDESAVEFIQAGPDASLNTLTGAIDRKCDLPKNELRARPIRIRGIEIGSINLCLVTVKNAYATNVIAYPGNSGSPAVNMWGNVIGVLFAGSTETHWGSVVPLQDLVRLLADY